MKTRHTFNIYFFLKKKSRRKDGSIPIYARIVVDGLRADLSAKEATLEEVWNSDAGRVNPKVKNAKVINETLDEVYKDLCQCKMELVQEGRFLTSQAVKLRYTGEDTPLKSLKDLFKYHQKNEVKKLDPGTAKNYGATEKYLLLYVKSKFKTTDIRLGQINYAFVLGFENYLRKCPPLIKSQPLNNNGIMKHMERFKKMTTIAVKLECLKKDPFTFFTASFDPFDRAFLTIEELSAIQDLDLKDIGLSRVRDIFVFACYTGLSYIDVKQLKPGHIVLGIDGDNWIFTSREKSNTSVKVPLLDEAMEILKKYSGKLYGRNEDLLLPVYANQKCNEYLKRIAVKCKIYKNITFHVARHTFATSVTLANGVPIETVSKLLGHKKLSTTQIYARVMERKISEDVAVLKSKLKIKHQNLQNVG
ncbi:site-specific integrase [Zobellia laminariae]|uniref:site-specific integrase n=1 Tax=Zobellia laminariae TaxID=248906 RepID=UPI0026F46520|nr:site-specific integrase [Zobellia laminariae]WKX76958.1 site-specific integrase [Zobellia laminariae]